MKNVPEKYIYYNALHRNEETEEIEGFYNSDQIIGESKQISNTKQLGKCQMLQSSPVIQSPGL